MRGIISFFLAGASVSGMAEAAPWVREDGGWYARLLAAHDTLDGAEGWRADLYGEYGLTPKLTVTAKSEAVTYPDFPAFDRSSTRLTLRRSLASHEGWVLGAEAGPFYGSTTTGINSCDGGGFETRLGGGWSGVYRTRALYGFLDVVHLAQSNDCSRFRIETGYGQDISRHLFIGQQLWFEEGDVTGRSVKTETQLGVHFNAFDLSPGYRDEIGGAFEESAVLIAVVARR